MQLAKNTIWEVKDNKYIGGDEGFQEMIQKMGLINWMKQEIKFLNEELGPSNKEDGAIEEYESCIKIAKEFEQFINDNKMSKTITTEILVIKLTQKSRPDWKHIYSIRVDDLKEALKEAKEFGQDLKIIRKYKEVKNA